MNNPSSPVIESNPTPNVSFKPLLPPPTLTRWQRFFRFMKTDEGGLLPMGIMVAGAHIFAAYYLMSEDFLDDFEDDQDAHTWVKKIVQINKSWRHNFDKIRENFTGFKG